MYRYLIKCKKLSNHFVHRILNISPEKSFFHESYDILLQSSLFYKIIEFVVLQQWVHCIKTNLLFTFALGQNRFHLIDSIERYTQ